MPEQGHAWGNGLETQKRKGRLKQVRREFCPDTHTINGRIGGEDWRRGIVGGSLDMLELDAA